VHSAGTLAREASGNAVSEVTGSQNEAFTYGFERRSNAVKRSDETSVKVNDNEELDAVELAKKGRGRGRGKGRKGRKGMCYGSSNLSQLDVLRILLYPINKDTTLVVLRWFR
jgi:hypothetical protein